MIDKTLRMALLYDAYGSLLTEKQRQFLAHYYHDDLSLGEIASNYGVSRQAVYDILKRAEATLTDLEAKLGLVRKAEELRRTAENMQLALQEIAQLLTELPAAQSARGQSLVAQLSQMIASLAADQ